ncbi:MAG: DUF47 family protein [Clostridia bacterium]|nr:DUF47 family protein [Clostridia bacterium]
MFRKSVNVHALIMNEIKSVKAALLGFEGFLRLAVMPDSTVETLQSLEKGVCEAEGEADIALRKMIDSLVSESFLPATKKELIEISTSCDRIANKCEHASTTLVLQNFRIPSEYAEDVMKIISISVKQFAILENTIGMMFSNFKPLVKDHSVLDEIRHLESEVDVLEEGIYRRIFNGEGELAQKMRLSNMIELICDISDIIENIADQLQIMLITRRA